jgi:hypothetical protein
LDNDKRRPKEAKSSFHPHFCFDSKDKSTIKITMKLSSSLLLLALGSTTNGFVTDKLAAPRTSSTELFARKAFITGNWKLNPQTKAEAVDLARGIASSITDDSPCDVGLFVPFPFIGTVQEIVGDKLVVGAEVGFVVDTKMTGATVSSIQDKFSQYHPF